MKFCALEIKNFRAITHLKLSDLSDVIVIAGPNGCGKSQIFHAIRLLKSVYGGYQPDEWRQWFNEFQVNLEQNPQNGLGLFHNRESPFRSVPN